MNREEQTSKRIFREEHQCKLCQYFDEKRCDGIDLCLIEEEERTRNAKPIKRVCPKDNEGGCPYGNDIGTCFGFCWKKILKEYREKRRKQEERNEA